MIKFFGKKAKKKKSNVAVAKQKLSTRIWRSRQVYLMILPVLVWFIMFEYWPLTWIRIAFYDYSLFHGIEGSEFVGFENFIKLIKRRSLLQMMWNALALNLWNLVLAFPAPIIFALMLNEMRFAKTRKIIQTISFLPHFLSLVAVVSIVADVLSPRLGLLGKVFELLNMEPFDPLGKSSWFRPIMTGSAIWQGFGWGAIVYLAALSAIDPTLYEAAMADGAGRWQRLLHVTIPGVLPTISIKLILEIGNLLKTGYEKILLLQNTMNLDVSEVLSTYMYKIGLQKMDYSMGAAVGIFNSIISLILVTIANKVSKRVSETSLW